MRVHDGVTSWSSTPAGISTAEAARRMLELHNAVSNSSFASGYVTQATQPVQTYDRPPIKRRADPDKGFALTHGRHWLWWRRKRCPICNPPEEVDPALVARLERELLDTSPQQWARDAAAAFDEEHRERGPNEPPRPPRPDRGERVRV